MCWPWLYLKLPRQLDQYASLRLYLCSLASQQLAEVVCLYPKETSPFCDTPVGNKILANDDWQQDIDNLAWLTIKALWYNTGRGRGLDTYSMRSRSES